MQIIMKYCAMEGFRTNRNMKCLRNINASDKKDYIQVTYQCIGCLTNYKLVKMNVN